MSFLTLRYKPRPFPSQRAASRSTPEATLSVTKTPSQGLKVDELPLEVLLKIIGKSIPLGLNVRNLVTRAEPSEVYLNSCKAIMCLNRQFRDLVYGYEQSDVNTLAKGVYALDAAIIAPRAINEGPRHYLLRLYRAQNAGLDILDRVSAALSDLGAAEEVKLKYARIGLKLIKYVHGRALGDGTPVKHIYELLPPHSFLILRVTTILITQSFQGLWEPDLPSRLENGIPSINRNDPLVYQTVEHSVLHSGVMATNKALGDAESESEYDKINQIARLPHLIKIEMKKRVSTDRAGRQSPAHAGFVSKMEAARLDLLANRRIGAAYGAGTKFLEYHGNLDGMVDALEVEFANMVEDDIFDHGVRTIANATMD